MFGAVKAMLPKQQVLFPGDSLIVTSLGLAGIQFT